MWGCAFHHSALNRFHMRNPCLRTVCLINCMNRFCRDDGRQPANHTYLLPVTGQTLAQPSTSSHYLLRTKYKKKLCTSILLILTMRFHTNGKCNRIEPRSHMFYSRWLRYDIIQKQQYMAEFSPMACYLCHFNII